MPTPAEHRQPTHRGLFISLVKDAALFPPAASPIPEALAEHARHDASPYSDVVGPFLVGVPMVRDLLAALDEGAPAPRAVGLVARPGTEVPEIDAALATLTADPRVRVVSVDAGWSPQWRNLDLGELPIHLEVGRDRPGDVLDDIASAAPFVDVRAKFRTGATPTWAWPGTEELAGFFLGATERQLPFVLTGGLHHVVRGQHPVHGAKGDAPEEQHGLLNVLVAVHGATGGSDAGTVRELLDIRDAGALADIVAAWSVPDIAAVRAALAGYGCCDVTDPIGELTDLGLLAAEGSGG